MSKTETDCLLTFVHRTLDVSVKEMSCRHVVKSVWKSGCSVNKFLYTLLQIPCMVLLKWPTSTKGARRIPLEINPPEKNPQTVTPRR